MRDQLPEQSHHIETGIIHLISNSGHGTDWVAYAIASRGIVYFDTYGLSPPVQFLNYISLPIFGFQRYRHILSKPPICGRESIRGAISKSTTPSRKVVQEYTNNRCTVI